MVGFFTTEILTLLGVATISAALIYRWLHGNKSDVGFNCVVFGVSYLAIAVFLDYIIDTPAQGLFLLLIRHEDWNWWLQLLFYFPGSLCVGFGILKWLPPMQQLEKEVLRRQEMEAELITAKEVADRSNRAKSEFLASMSHELRTPLNAIIGFSSMMVSQIYGEHRHQKYLEYSQDISNSASHLLAIVNDVLDLSKIEAGEYDLQVSDVSLTNDVDACLKLLTAKSHAVSDRFQVDIAPDAETLRADGRYLKQILLNILRNADKYTEPDGAITVTAFRNRRRDIEIQITDTGSGIAPEDIEKVKEPFGQAGAGAQTTHEGTGLGLSISSKLMDLHGGRLQLQSQVGVGTTVILSFPDEMGAAG